MSFILNIDTAVRTASVCLSRDGKSVALRTNPSQQDHSAWLHTAIADLLRENDLTLHQLNAIAISAGPGSYTGLRVGMSAAKGLCYALGIPLITINTLEMMAAAMQPAPGQLLCPMIDARRMEVFTAVFDDAGRTVLAPVNIILDEHSFHDLLERSTMIFFGNGSLKFAPLVRHPHALFESMEATAEAMCGLSQQYYQERIFADLAYSEPFYGKD